MTARTLVGVSLSVILAAGCRSADVRTTQPAFVAQPAPVDASMLPANTLVSAELNHTLSTRNSRVGDRFTARVIETIRAQNGEVVIPEGAVINGTVTGLRASQHAGDQAIIRVNFESMQIGAVTLPFSAEIVETEAGLKNERRRAERGMAAGATTGAVLGAVIRGPRLSSILRGAAIGAGAGTVLSLGAGEVDAALESGTDMTLRTTAPMRLR